MSSNADDAAASAAPAAPVVAANEEAGSGSAATSKAAVAAAAPAVADSTSEGTDSPSSSALRKLRSSSLDATAKAFIPGAAFAAAVPAPVEHSAPQKQTAGRSAGGGGGGGSALPDFSPEQSEALRHQVSTRIHY
jgi:hypothetical protein